MTDPIRDGDCVEVMATLDADSIDAIVTDPPYGLEFMGKEWDKFGAGISAAPAQPGPWARRSGVSYHAGGAKAGIAFQEWCYGWGGEALRIAKPGAYLLAFGGTRTHHRLVCGLEDAGWLIRDELDWIYASGFPKGKAQLKPAREPIVLARKPGALQPLNIDAARIPTNGEVLSYSDSEVQGATPFGTGSGEQSPQGRWPSNVLLTDAALFDEPNPYVIGSGAITGHAGSGWSNSKPAEGTVFAGVGGTTLEDYEDVGGYARFFIVPKADRSDREPVVRGTLPRGSLRTMNDGIQGHDPDAPIERENHHPTVKPTDLMRHLVRLVTPIGGLVLDPFLGSGTTGLAAELEGFPWMGIERDPEYAAIARARLNGTQRGMGLDVPAPTEVRRLGPDVGPGRPEICKFYPGKCEGHPGHGIYSRVVHTGNGTPAPVRPRADRPVEPTAPMFDLDTRVR